MVLPASCLRLMRELIPSAEKGRLLVRNGGLRDGRIVRLCGVGQRRRASAESDSFINTKNTNKSFKYRMFELIPQPRPSTASLIQLDIFYLVFHSNNHFKVCISAGNQSNAPLKIQPLALISFRISCSSNPHTLIFTWPRIWSKSLPSR